MVKEASAEAGDSRYATKWLRKASQGRMLKGRRERSSRHLETSLVSSSKHKWTDQRDSSSGMCQWQRLCGTRTRDTAESVSAVVVSAIIGSWCFYSETGHPRMVLDGEMAWSVFYSSHFGFCLRLDFYYRSSKSPWERLILKKKFMFVTFLHQNKPFLAPVSMKFKKYT